MNPSTIGVDVSKDWLDAHRLSDGADRRFVNDKAGRKALMKWLSAAPVKLVVFEPTGLYHRALERALDAAGLAIAMVNPRQARRFAEAAGKLVKTDRADAAMLARMGEVLKLEARPCVSQSIADLKELHLARCALVKDRTAARNRAKSLSIALLKRQNVTRLAEIEEKIRKIEAAIQQLIGQDAELARRFDILLSIPGVSKITAFALLIEMPELGTLEGKQAAASPVSRPSRDNPERGKDMLLSEAEGPFSAKPFTCPLSLYADSTRTSKPPTKDPSKPESPQKSPSQPSCESYCCSPMRCCEPIGRGSKKPLDEHGYSSRPLFTP